MMTRRASRWAWAVWSLSTALFLAGLGFLVLSRSASVPESFGTTGFASTTTVIFATVGALIASKQPRNAVGWIFCAAGLLFGLLSISEGYSVYALLAADGRPPGGEVFAWLVSWLWIPVLGTPVTLVLLLFPDGRLVSRRWRPVAWIAVTGLGVTSAMTAILPGPLEDATYANNPFGIEAAGGLEGPLNQLLIVFLLFVPLACAFSLFLRFRRAPSLERQQIKWLTFAGAVAAIVFPIGGILSSGSDPFLSEAAADAIILVLQSIPIAIGIAILRYRLYDIDRIINRTLTYALLTAGLAVIYFGLVVGLQAALRSVSGGSDLAIVVTTLVVAALFLPARRRVQTAVDRRFNRRAYDAARTIDAFSARLREQIDLDTLRYELLSIVYDTMQPARVSVWLREAEGAR
jgi:hypothetical protein